MGVPGFILAADIGGTHCRFGLFAREETGLRMVRSVWRPTRDLHDIDDVLRAWNASDLGRPADAIDAMTLAVAGPVFDPLHGNLTNASLRLDLSRVATRLGPGHARLINDFTAQAYACLTPVGERARQVLPRAPLSVPEHGSKGVVGAGTGFGTASLIYDSAGTWLAVPAEGGHVAFPFVGKEEADFHDFVRSELRYPYARGDDVLTGSGLTLLHRFLTGTTLPPREVAATALAGDTPTRRWYARFFGRACRDWMLTTLCRGGLYIAGGIIAKNPAVPACPEFADALYSTPQYRDLIASIPVRINEDENSGLWGAAWVGARLL